MRPESEAKTELGKRLRAIRTAAGNPSREEFAAKLDLNVKTIAAYERGERTPDANALAAYRECFAVNADWVVSGEGKMNRYAVLQPDRMDRAIADGRTVVRAKDPSEGFRYSSEPNSPDTTEKDAVYDMASIPIYDGINASAGRGVVPGAELAKSVIAFDPQYLRDHGANPRTCSVITAQGESMRPTVPDGALLVVDHSQTSVEHGCIYVFNVADRLVVKRARWSMDKHLTLMSDNPSPDYPDEVIKAENADQLIVVGRVVFHGSRV